MIHAPIIESEGAKVCGVCGGFIESNETAHVHMTEIEYPKCPDCKKELAHTNTTHTNMLFACMNLNCDNYHYFLINGERAYKDKDF